MTSSDTHAAQEIYVPIGDDQSVKLTLVSLFQNISQVRRFLHSVQDTFSVELNCCVTITDNLKIQCVSHRACNSCPLYILEFDDVSQGYALWKSPGDWALGIMLTSLYATKNGARRVHPTLKALVAEQVSSKHDAPFLMETLQKLNVDWDNIDTRFDFTLFLKLLEEALELEIGTRDYSSYLDIVTRLQYKSLMTMAVLRTKVAVSKRLLEKSLCDYDSRMRAADDACKEASREASVLSDSIVHSRSPSTSAPAPDDEYLLSSKQLVTNFQNHFRNMAETFETFDVKSSIKCPTPRTSSSTSWKVSKPSKNGKSKEVHA